MDFRRAATFHFLARIPRHRRNCGERAELVGFQRRHLRRDEWLAAPALRAARGAAHEVGLRRHANGSGGSASPDDSVGLGSYGVDDWPHATVAHEGGIALNGGEFSIMKANPKHSGIHRIPYRAIRPKQGECENLLVPVCCSASHIAMTSIRMEPVWITLGLSAGIAAAHALKEKVAVQTVDFRDFVCALLDAGQVLEHDETMA